MLSSGLIQDSSSTARFSRKLICNCTTISESLLGLSASCTLHYIDLLTLLSSESTPDSSPAAKFILPNPPTSHPTPYNITSHIYLHFMISLMNSTHSITLQNQKLFLFTYSLSSSLSTGTPSSHSPPSIKFPYASLSNPSSTAPSTSLTSSDAISS